ncbi:hypothetical protein THASP1DRAFT_28993 [Thamnocephalis sphaerospora]|uniref:Uncharacterized protein n=1 Tax=Thamnocephalis sphaerospora TaxID=78915 RepID=A0A4P9XUF9_9FUNG|nr:hypothetical protein THASP1DRAFT_28993 [Thamnocephalis sphaerospora]|eukprot:RKP09221.1 hypothetical protein THASP1DRAFT_28993 [Thamnocephalis sphaerospora]
MPTANYLQFKQPEYDRTGMVYVPRFSNGCQIEKPPAANISRTVTAIGRRVDWTITLVVDSAVWQAGCESYKQIAQSIFDKRGQLQEMGWMPLGALVIASPREDEILAGPTDAFCRPGQADEPCSQPPMAVSSAVENNLVKAGAVPLSFITMQEGRAAHSWLRARNESDVLLATATHEAGVWNGIYLSGLYEAKTWAVTVLMIAFTIYAFYRMLRLLLSDMAFWCLRTVIVMMVSVCHIPFTVYYLYALLSRHETISVAFGEMLAWTGFSLCIYYWRRTGKFSFTPAMYTFDGLLVLNLLLIYVSQIWQMAAPTSWGEQALPLVALQQALFCAVAVLYIVLAFLLSKKPLETVTEETANKLRRRAACCIWLIILYGVYTIVAYYMASDALYQPRTLLSLGIVRDALLVLLHWTILVHLNVPYYAMKTESVKAQDMNQHDAYSRSSYCYSEDNAEWTEQSLRRASMEEQGNMDRRRMQDPSAGTDPWRDSVVNYFA